MYTTYTQLRGIFLNNEVEKLKKPRNAFIPTRFVAFIHGYLHGQSVFFPIQKQQSLRKEPYTLMTQTFLFPYRLSLFLGLGMTPPLQGWNVNQIIADLVCNR